MKPAADEPPAYDAWLTRLRDEPGLFDTMIVRGICVGGGADALGRAFEGRILMPEAVLAECNSQASGRPGRVPGIPELRRFLDTYPITEIELGPEDDEEVDDIRLDMGPRAEAKAKPKQHLGEAQCLLLAERHGHILVTNDGAARARARAGWDPATNSARSPGLKRVDPFHIIEVLYVCIRLGTIRPGAAWTVYERAVAGGLFVSPGFAVPGSRERFLRDASEMASLHTANPLPLPRTLPPPDAAHLDVA